MEKRNRKVQGRREKSEARLADAIRRSGRLIDPLADGVQGGAAIKEKPLSITSPESAELESLTHDISLWLYPFGERAFRSPIVPHPDFHKY